MKIVITKHAKELGRCAGQIAAELILEAINMKGSANIVLATGSSQFETLEHLTEEKKLDWSKVVMFHLDEYIGLPITSRASFRKYLKDRFLSKVPPLKEVHFINGEAKPDTECNRLNKLIARHEIDVALVGVGENGHLAFNDPPADFETEQPYIIVKLDNQCRMQQYSEGWFDSFEDIPTEAISMSVQQILKSKNIICSIPDKRKAMAVKHCLENGVTNLHPASILQLHPNCTYFLDEHSSALLSQRAHSKIINAKNGNH